MAHLNIPHTFDLAFQHHQAGRLREAEQLYRQILIQQPEHAGALHFLGVLSHQLGKPDLAADLIRQAIALQPNLPDPHINLGNVMKGSGHLDAAITEYRRAIALQPNSAQVHNSLGNALRDQGQLDAAISAYRQAIALNPKYPDAGNNLAIALTEVGRLDDAVMAARQAIALEPNFPEAHNNLGVAFGAKGQVDEAVAAFGQAIARRPTYAEAHSNLGVALLEAARIDESIAACRKAIALRPGYAEAHFNLAMALLFNDWEQGWLEYEWRLKLTSHSSLLARFSQPLWDGSDLNGRTILLYAEQGYGDTIQFIRYLPLVVERGGRVIVEAQPELIRLLRNLPGVEQWIPHGQPLPAHDVHFSLLSLPRLFGTTLQTIPPQRESLRPDPDLIETWRHRLESHQRGLKVGLAWAGNPNCRPDRTRSMTLDRLAALSDVSGVTFFSLQKGAAAKQADQPPAGLRLVNLSEELNDFADTATVMCLMDLVITTDTSVAHLAGALGRPVWTMLQFSPDWRWLLDRPDSPWYPTMRLFRQTSLGDWAGVISRIVQSLSVLSAERKA